MPFVQTNTDKVGSRMSQEFPAYRGVGKEFSSHKVVNHGNKEFVNGDGYTNTVEGLFSLKKEIIAWLKLSIEFPIIILAITH